MNERLRTKIVYIDRITTRSEAHVSRKALWDGGDWWVRGVGSGDWWVGGVGSGALQWRERLGVAT